jgi:hypothetical protein
MMTRFGAILQEHELSNHALVEINPGHLHHKAVQKARLGKRPLSPKMQLHLVDALNKLTLPETPWKKADLFDAEGNAIGEVG